MTPFRGLCAFPITPCDAAGHVDEAGLIRLLDRLIAAEVDSIGLLGSTGTYAYLDRAERRRAVEIAVRRVGGRMPILVGIGALRTDHAVSFGQDAKAAGADAALLAAMSYTPLTEEEVFAHYETVAGAIGMPVCVYDNPATTHVSIGTGLVLRLSRIGNVAAVKLPGGAEDVVRAQLDLLRAEAAAGLAVGYSGDWHATGAMLAGADGWYSVAAGLFPGPCLAIMQAVAAGDADAARRLDARMAPLWALFQRFGSLRVMFACANRLGLTDAQPPRPILPLEEAAQREVGRVLEVVGLR